MRSFKVLVALMALSVSAYAGPNETEARARVDQGTMAFNLGHFDESAVHYQAAYDLTRDPNLLFYLGRSYSVGGKHEQALCVLRRFLLEAPPDAPDRSLAQRFIDELKRRVDENKATAACAPVSAPAPAAPSASGSWSAPDPANAPAPVSAYAPAPAPGPVQAAPVPTPAPAPSAPAQPQPLFAPDPQFWPTPAPAASSPAPGLLAQPSPPASDATAGAQPFYKTWWFWTAAGAVVVAGTVTAFLLVHRTPDACGGVGMDCVRVK